MTKEEFRQRVLNLCEIWIDSEISEIEKHIALMVGMQMLVSDLVYNPHYTDAPQGGIVRDSITLRRQDSETVIDCKMDNIPCTNPLLCDKPAIISDSINSKKFENINNLTEFNKYWRLTRIA